MLSNSLNVYIPVGAQKRQEFEMQVDDFIDDFDFHLYLRGQPGVGKTRYVKQACDNGNVVLCHIEGKVTRWYFLKKLALYLYNAGWPTPDKRPGVDFDPEELPKVVVAFDDVPTIFDPDFIDMLKIGLEEEESDKMTYQVSLGGQYAQAEPYEKVAIDHFREEGSPGFTLNFYGMVKFVFMMNHALADEHDVEMYKKHNKNPSQGILTKMNDQAALMTRLQYKDLHMTKDEYWGWIADLVVNHNVCTGATKQDQDEMLEWLYSNWDNLREKSVRLVKQKLWKDLAKSKKRANHDYRARWNTIVKQGA